MQVAVRRKKKASRLWQKTRASEHLSLQEAGEAGKNSPSEGQKGRDESSVREPLRDQDSKLPAGQGTAELAGGASLDIRVVRTVKGLGVATRKANHGQKRDKSSASENT